MVPAVAVGWEFADEPAQAQRVICGVSFMGNDTHRAGEAGGRVTRRGDGAEGLAGCSEPGVRCDRSASLQEPPPPFPPPPRLPPQRSAPHILIFLIIFF